MSHDRFFVCDFETTGVDDSDVPIEVGIVVTDDRWNELGTYESLIYTPQALTISHDRWTAAQRFHGIERAEVTAAPLAKIVAAQIHKLYREHKDARGRLILLSDNIQFEWRHMAKLLAYGGLGVRDLFHYCGWDTSILSLFTDFEDPQDVPHRALPDAKLLVEALRKTRVEDL